MPDLFEEVCLAQKANWDDQSGEREYGSYIATVFGSSVPDEGAGILTLSNNLPENTRQQLAAQAEISLRAYAARLKDDPDWLFLCDRAQGIPALDLIFGRIFEDRSVEVVVISSDPDFPYPTLSVSLGSLETFPGGLAGFMRCGGLG